MNGNAILARTAGERTKAEREAESRRRIATKLAAIESHQLRCEFVKGMIQQAGATIRSSTDGFRLKLLGRVATCTYSPDGAIGNWIAAVLKEAFRA